MESPDSGLKQIMHLLNIDEDSSSLLRERCYVLSGEEETEEQSRNVGRKYLICLTIGTGGLQMIWTAIMGHGSLYLSSLGLPPYVVSFIWLAGPLSGAIIQPCISVLSDHSHRRKPYILYGTIFTIIFMLLLPWTGDIINYLYDTFGNSHQSALIARGVVATSLIWGLNIAIQPVQMGTRALICEACPLHQNVQAAAYASCMTCIGSIFGYASGLVSLPQFLPWFGDTQFKDLCVVASFTLGLTIAVTLCVVEENKVVFDNKKKAVSIVNVLRHVYTGVVYMPKDMKRICKVQFFAWLGWFPFLFYITTYLSSLYENNFLVDSTDDVPSRSHVNDDDRRYGDFTMVLFAIVAFLSNILLPLIVSSSKREILTSRLVVRCLTLPRAWTASHILTSVLLLSISLTRSTALATFLVSSLGVSWALTQWVPLALISVAIQSHQTTSLRDTLYSNINTDSDLELECRTHNDYTSNIEVEIEGEEVFEVPRNFQAGTIMGVYNVAIAAPQILAALGSSGIFWLLNWFAFDDTEVFGWAIRILGIAGLMAAWLSAEIE